MTELFRQLIAADGFHEESTRAAGLGIGGVGFAVKCGDDDNGEFLRFFVGAYAAARFEPVDPGHYQIEKHQIRGLLLHLVERLLAVRGGDEIIAGVGDVPVEDSDHAFLIVNNEDLLASLGGHSKTSLVGSIWTYEATKEWYE